MPARRSLISHDSRASDLTQRRKDAKAAASVLLCTIASLRQLGLTLQLLWPHVPPHRFGEQRDHRRPQHVQRDGAGRNQRGKEHHGSQGDEGDQQREAACITPVVQRRVVRGQRLAHRRLLSPVVDL